MSNTGHDASTLQVSECDDEGFDGAAVPGNDSLPLPRMCEIVAQGPSEEEQGPRPTTKASMQPEDMANMLDTCLAEIEALKRKHDLMIQKQEGADSVRRGQLDCISERIYQAEKDLRQAQQRQDDAIEKASATFQKHACDVEQERQNLMCVINQVNQNFEHLSSEIAQHGVTMNALEQNMMQLQGTVSQSNVDSRNAVMNLGHEMAVLERAVQQQQQRSSELQLLEHTVQQQQQQIKDLQTSVQAMHDAMVHFTEADVRQQALADQFTDLQGLFNDSQAQQQALLGQLSEVRDQVTQLAGEVARVASAPDPPLPIEVATTVGGSAAAMQQGEWLPLMQQIVRSRHAAEQLPHGGRATAIVAAPSLGQPPLIESRSGCGSSLLADGSGGLTRAGVGARADLVAPMVESLRGDVRSSARLAHIGSESILAGSGFGVSADFSAGSEEALHNRQGDVWHERLGVLYDGDLGGSPHVDDRFAAHQEVANAARFESVFQVTAPSRRGSTRPPVPEPSAVPAPIMTMVPEGLEGAYIGL
mmetsp:Transcript_30534/g.84252  ORF Transcript_30534/g.84252 Transcript_30534/m.84252 type:complete len:532 (-) Transcript_30534:117-1712(-)|eukprot:CAMPEP_0179065828 /NCGR_PEP_ID=MMETSP0796-20121207/28663_1 /TAXON_ID=73915 /ORGANISM="Pyrodinium bahamense, Strain pbaha01" /LENGTH=531 /DNA_ID=CAMNT_0020762815 /DNA_START=70 /DNA_END=1665 /DNA_ORIENTATION=-